jgi:acetyl-CoA carboxylase biotin carboxylase subunit
VFRKILIANRGEIAIRIIRACKEMGIKTVAIHSEIDKDSLHLRYADEKICVGPADNSLSYRNIPNILSAAEVSESDAIHPGYGFLAENAHFAEVCQSAGIKFIGPSPESIALMGDKAKAREIMQKAGVPVLPGSPGVVSSEGEALEVSKWIGFPIIIKASAGGGGRGMRVVFQEDELNQSLQAAQAEAKGAFGNSDVYIEKYYQEPRHVEAQILADSQGRTLFLGERECSVQRRHQKLVEEAPSPAVDDQLREEMGKIAVDAAKTVGYVNAGTVEFLLDQDQNFYFIEMNTRIQVEHPVTEMVTGIDLIKEQIKICAGDALDIHQEDVHIKGHSFECRINAECPERFTPCPGIITDYHVPGGPGVRVDGAVTSNYIVPPQYDSLIAKLIVFGVDRPEAILRMQRALDEFVVEGIKTTLPLHRRIFTDPNFKKGRYSTKFLDRLLSQEKVGM